MRTTIERCPFDDQYPQNIYTEQQYPPENWMAFDWMELRLLPR